MQPIRFIHASHLLLDHLPAGIDWRDPQLAAVAEQCTLIAFRRLIESAMAEEADFVLLAGNCFDMADWSLQSETALIRGLNQLAAQGIDVYIVPGDGDPPEAWEAMDALPENTVVLGMSDDSPCFFTRGGEAVACIQFSGKAANDSAFVSPQGAFPLIVHRGADSPLSLHEQFVEERLDESAAEYELVSSPVNGPSETSQNSQRNPGGSGGYWALAEGDVRRTVSVGGAVAHHPGCTQALSPQQTGAGGCTMVEVDSSGAVELTFLPTAPLRFETIEVNIDAETQRNEILDCVSTAIGAIHRHPTDSAWLVSWNFTGEGPQKHLADDPEFCREIDGAIRESYSGDDVIIRSGGRIPHVGGPLPSWSLPTEGMTADFLEQLANPESNSSGDASAMRQRSCGSEGAYSSRLRVLSQELDGRQIFAEAELWGRTWFAGTMEESA